MKCINDEMIQKYIDGEINVQEAENIAKHAEKCAFCAQKIAEQRTFANYIKKEVENWSAEPVAIPEFVAPNLSKRRFIIQKKYYIYATSAAACAIFLVFFLLPKENKVSDYQMIYCFDGDFDSNRPYSQQEMTIKVFDSNGKMIEFN